MMRNYFLLAIVSSIILLPNNATACKKKKAKNTATEVTQKAVDAVNINKDVAINPSEFSTKIKPNQDFFEYINEKWIAENPIPSDKAAYGMFDKLDEQSKQVIKKILDNAAASTNAPKGSNLQKLGDFYRSGLDSVAINKAGITPLQSYFTKIENLKTPTDVVRIFSELGMRDINNPLGYYVDADAKNTSRYITYVNQGGLGLPDKDFYFRTDEKSKKNLEAYKNYIKTLFTAAGLDKTTTAEQQMQNVIDVELKLADASLSRVELRDPEKNYNLYTIEKLKTDFPNIDWKTFFDVMKIAPKEVVIGQPTFYKELNNFLVNIPADKWKSYLEFHLLNGTAKYLDDAIANARFDYYGKTLSGIQEKEPRWKRVSHVAENYLRDLIGQEYVKTNFSPAAKSRALELIANIKAALKDRIDQLTWMSAETKSKALDKLAKIDVKVGYPDKWWTYEKDEISNQPYVNNVLNTAYGENLRVLERLNKKEIDRTEWGMGPQTVNAYYNPIKNEIVFPAAILQPPFFYEDGDDAVNYGGIGMVIGHEITHGFDDQGSQFDAEGNLKNWWTEADRKNYEALTNKFVERYNEFKPFDGDSLHINGELTLGENIADLGGMIISFNALQKALTNKKVALINGLTPDQRFFINYAIIWRSKFRPEALRMQVLSNEHSPAKFRVNGVLENLPQFHKAFNVKPGDAMYRNEAVRSKMW